MGGLLASLAVAGVAHAQITSVDPNGVFEVPPAPSSSAAAPSSSPTPPASPDAAPATVPQGPVDSPAAPASPAPASPTTPDAAGAAKPIPADAPNAVPTHKKDDLIGAAEGVFGKGAQGLAEMIEKILKEQGEPNAYIAGREASGAFVVGLRYGSGTMVHKVEGQRPVYWTGPSLGLDFGGDATKTFILVYNLFDSQDLYERFAQVEGRAYFLGGLSATYLRRENIVVVPIRMGVGMRLGANLGYMKFTEKSRWSPF
jgi:hypothetical protein